MSVFGVRRNRPNEPIGGAKPPQPIALNGIEPAIPVLE
jgi:hypothetical protein